MAFSPRYRPRFGLGDWATDDFLATPQGQAALATAKAAAAQLPSGFTMGDPTSDLWGATYYQGRKVIEVGQAGPGGQLYYGLEDGSLGPVVSDAINQAITNAANAAYAVYNYINGLRTSTNPQMVAVLSDPEWIALQGKQVIWSALSPELQAKIKLVPNLYNALTAGDPNATPETPPPPPPPPAAPSGPAMYLVAGYLFDANGVIYDQSTHKPTGATFTPDEVHSLLTTSQLPAGATPPGPSAPPPATPPGTTTPPAPPVPQSPPPVSGPPAPQGPMDTTPQGPPVTMNSGGPEPVLPPPGTAAPATTGDSNWMLYAALGVIALVAIRKRS